MKKKIRPLSINCKADIYVFSYTRLYRNLLNPLKKNWPRKASGHWFFLNEFMRSDARNLSGNMAREKRELWNMAQNISVLLFFLKTITARHAYIGVFAEKFQVSGRRRLRFWARRRQVHL